MQVSWWSWLNAWLLRPFIGLHIRNWKKNISMEEKAKLALDAFSEQVIGGECDWAWRLETLRRVRQCSADEIKDRHWNSQSETGEFHSSFPTQFSLRTCSTLWCHRPCNSFLPTLPFLRLRKITRLQQASYVFPKYFPAPFQRQVCLNSESAFERTE